DHLGAEVEEQMHGFNDDNAMGQQDTDPSEDTDVDEGEEDDDEDIGANTNDDQICLEPNDSGLNPFPWPIISIAWWLPLPAISG
ncbi:hypothetical protein FRC11_001946, partial [Ceratobasidium sp. 423]